MKYNVVYFFFVNIYFLYIGFLYEDEYTLVYPTKLHLVVIILI